jgi:hypothetical protein
MTNTQRENACGARGQALRTCPPPPQAQQLQRTIHSLHKPDSFRSPQQVMGASRDGRIPTGPRSISAVLRPSRLSRLVPAGRRSHARASTVPRAWRNRECASRRSVFHLRQIGDQPRTLRPHSAFAVDGRPELAMVVYNPATPADADRVRALLAARST